MDTCLEFKVPNPKYNFELNLLLGGLLSPTAAEESLKFTVTLVTGDDVIPRLSLSNIAKLSEE